MLIHNQSSTLLTEDVKDAGIFVLYMQVFSLTLVHKEREVYLERRNDNVNHFMIIARDENQAKLVFEQWYDKNIISGKFPYEKYDLTIQSLTDPFMYAKQGIISKLYAW